ncbi:MAG: hypothetical protein CMM61_09845 [Rhodospirillaceae bacterium]|nr:hypothetical protein [Rhodospirillaceae bacterium]
MMDIPSAPLGEIASIVRGVTFSKSDAVNQPADGHLPVLRAGNIQDSLVLDDDLVYVPREKVNEKQILRKGDIVICTSSGSSEVVGKTARATHDWEGSFGAFCAGIRARRNKCDPSFLFYYLKSPQFRLWTQRSSGANIKNIRKSELDLFEVPLPPLSEQRRIAAILDKADGIRRKREQVLVMIDGLLQSTFLEMFGHPLSPSAKLPVKPLSELGRIDTGKTPPTSDPNNYGSGVPFVTPGDLGDLVFLTNREISEKGTSSSKVVERGATMVCCIGATIGKMGLVTQRSAFNQQINAVSWGEKIDPLYGYIGMTFLAAHIANAGTSTTLPILKKSSFSKINFPVPPIERQREFSRIVEAAWSSKERQTGQLHEAENFFQSLSQRAFRGEL